MKNIILVLVAAIIVAVTPMSVSADWDDDNMWALTDEDPNELRESFQYDTDYSSGKLDEYASGVYQMQRASKEIESYEKEYSGDRLSIDEEMAQYATGGINSTIYSWILGD